MSFRSRRRVAPLAFSRPGIAAALLIAAGALPAAAQTAPSGATPAPAPAATGRAAATPPAGSVGGVGDVNLYPKRVVITDRQRIATVGLFNRAASTGDYDIVLADTMMTPEGKMIDAASVADPTQKARMKGAAALLRYSPRKVTLQGNEAQTVRIMAHVPPELPPGEYHTHFQAIAVPADAVGGLNIDKAAGQGGNQAIGVTIVPRFGIAIPVIVRVGETTLTAGLQDLKVIALPDGHKAVQLTITRAGTRSAFGDIEVSSPDVKHPIAEIKGIGVYTEIDRRTVTIPIDPLATPAAYAPGARLTVTYSDDDVSPGKVLVRQVFVVP